MAAMDVTIATIDAPFGWTAVVWLEQTVIRLTLGHRSPEAAVRAAGYRYPTDCSHTFGRAEQSLLDQLAAYGAGQIPDFSEVRVEIGAPTRFAQRVLNQCRRIPWGQTITYGQLATRCGSPGAARAVGNVMARNRVPLIVPCHRVVAAGGKLGGFSAPTGVRMKRRLLALESAEPVTA